MHLLITLVTGLYFALGLGFVYWLASAIYNLFLHPLAKVPGPKLHAISELPYLLRTLNGTWARRIQELHEIYGPVVRVAPNDVSFITAEAWKTIYGFKSDRTRNYLKDERTFREHVEPEVRSIATAEGDAHRRQRRLLAHAFSDKALHGQEDVVKHYIDLLMTGLREVAASQKPDNILRWYNFTSFDVIGDLSFGLLFHGLETNSYHPWLTMIFAVLEGTVWIHFVRRVAPRALVPWLYPRFMPKRLRSVSSDHLRRTVAAVEQRIDSGNTAREDFMSYILRHNSEEKGMTRGEIMENSSSLIIAGSETTATALSGITYYLLTFPATYKRLVAEIRGTFASEEDITSLAVARLEYLSAVIEEGLRMYPPGPLGLPRIVPQGGEVIEGYFIPENTIVSVPQFATYRSGRNFAQPDSFIPERWLGAPGFENDNRDAMNPFSTGPRNCMGKNLAYLEMRNILARLLWNFDLELMPESKDWADQKVFLTWQKKPLMIKVHPVKRDQ